MATVQISKKQREFLQSTAKNVLFVGGVGSGKTVVAAEKTVQLILLGAYVLCLASTYKQLKLVLFEEIQNRLRLHNIEYTINKSDMVIDIPSTGGKIFGYSTESIESVRGITADVVILDEAALMLSYHYQVCLGRLRRGHVPLQTFITTTPRGKDSWIYDISLDPQTHYIHQTTMENPFLPKEFIDELKKQYTGDLLEQELNGQFISGNNELQFIPMTTYIESLGNRAETQPDELKVGGLDVARYGKDSSVLTYRQGNTIVDIKKWNQLDTVILVEEVVNYVIEHNLDYLVVDSVGLGAGVFDSLNDKLKTICRVIEFNGGYRATDDKKYANKRAEAFGRMKEWMLSGGKMTEEFSDVTSFRFKLNSKGLIQLEAKTDLKTRTGKSPDEEDSLSMTFAVDAKKMKSRVERSRVSKKKVNFRQTFSG